MLWRVKWKTMDKKWHDLIINESQKDYFKALQEFVDKEYESKTVFPPREEVFNAFKLTPFDNVKVVIIGQDPYFNPMQAHGLCFSVRKGVKIPPSLVNIYKELHSDVGITIPNTGDLTYWAKQGVLLLNAVLTVEAFKPLSHNKKGWEEFTQHMIEELNKDDAPKVFMLWGAKAIEKEKMITNPNHLILKAAHPSPLSAYNGFFGCRHFSKANEFLINKERKPIDWQIR